MESKTDIEDCKSDFLVGEKFDADDIGSGSKEIEDDLSNLRLSSLNKDFEDDSLTLVGEAKDGKRKGKKCCNNNYRQRSSTIQSTSEEKDEVCNLQNQKRTKIKNGGSEIVDKVIELMLGSEMASEFEKFARDNIGPFKEYAEMYDNLIEDNEVEYTLEQMDIYNLYLNTFEKKVEKFIQNCGYDIEDFFGECANILDDEEESFEFNPRKFFINSILSTMEFKVFFNMMYVEAKRLMFEAEQEGKEG